MDIPDPIYRALKQEAARRGCSIKELVLESVEKELRTPEKGKRVRLPLLKSKEPGTMDLTNEEIYEAIPFP